MEALLNVILTLIPYGGGLLIMLAFNHSYPEAPNYMDLVVFLLGYLFVAVPTVHKS